MQIKSFQCSKRCRKIHEFSADNEDQYEYIHTCSISKTFQSIELQEQLSNYNDNLNFLHIYFLPFLTTKKFIL